MAAMTAEEAAESWKSIFKKGGLVIASFLGDRHLFCRPPSAPNPLRVFCAIPQTGTNVKIDFHAAEWGKTLDFPTVWAALVNQGERMEQANKELGERLDQSTANVNKMITNTEERLAQSTAIVNKMAEKVDRVLANLGGVNCLIGELEETLFIPHFGEKFAAYNYNLRRIYGHVPIYDNDVIERGVIDILLSDTVACMAVEVRQWLDKKNQVDQHVRRMRLIWQYPPAEAKGKKLLGAIAAAVVIPEVREYAEEKGFFVLELTGEDVRLLEPPQGFQPKEW